MPHADTDTGAVTARALATIEQARDIHAAIPPENPFEAITLHGMRIAAAAVRLTVAMTLTPDIPWWATYAEAAEPWGCAGCGGGSDRWDRLTHADNCPALALSAAIRAAGEAGT